MAKQQQQALPQSPRNPHHPHLHHPQQRQQQQQQQMVFQMRSSGALLRGRQVRMVGVVVPSVRAVLLVMLHRVLRG
jgi:hypothetical protein